jgi:hypothetical protein
VQRSSTAENLPPNNAIEKNAELRKPSKKGKSHMSHGWAYKVGDVYSETFPSRESAQKAANRAAREQRTPGDDEAIEFEDSDGKWHDEDAKGIDRPDTDVKG